MARLYDIEKGEIYIDNNNILNFTLDSLRKQISIISQDTTLFHRTLYENIQYGNINATEKEVIEASKNAQAHEFILQTPNKYDSIVGEKGVKISGGQRQRIGIARTFLKNTPILILDESTSQLDSINEMYIQKSIDKVMENKTTVVIAHRLSTISKMDRIIVLDNGKIIEDGRHEELLKKQGKYFKLWNTQVDGYIAI